MPSNVIDDARKTMTLAELAPLLGVAKSTLYEHAARNNLPVPVIRVGRRYVVSRAHVENLLGQIEETEVEE